jgi:hypothetical protein
MLLQQYFIMIIFMEATPEGNHTNIYDTNRTLGTNNIMTGSLKSIKFSFDAAEISQLPIY